MEQKINIHDILANQAMAFYPKTLANEILADKGFRKKYNFYKSHRNITFGNKFSFEVNELFKKTAHAINNVDEKINIVDQNNTLWSIDIVDEENYLLAKFSSEASSFSTRTFWPLILNKNDRLKKYYSMAKQEMLSGDLYLSWENKIQSTPLNFLEWEELINDLDSTPKGISKAIENDLKAGEGKIENLIPNSLAYYESLIGKYNNSKDIEEHFKSFQLFEQLSNSKIEKEDILLRVLLLAAHSSFKNVLNRNILNEKDLIFLSNWGKKYGDPFSIVGIIELCLPFVNEYKWLEKTIKKLAQKLLNNKEDKEMHYYTYPSALIRLIDGELSRLGIFEGKPPFYRRLASFAQAAHITRLFIKINATNSDFIEWAETRNARIFFCQAFIDFIEEPRWMPEGISSDGLRAEYLGRLMLALSVNSNLPKKWKPINVKKIEKKFGTMMIYQSSLPGPLEGGVDNLPDMPMEYLKILEEQLNPKLNLPNSFTVLINSALRWKVSKENIEVVINKLIKQNHVLLGLNKKTELLVTLEGLAQISAVNKDTKLAEQITILFRKYREHLDVKSEPEVFLGICLIAASSHQDEPSWSNYIGIWATELALLSLDKKAATNLYHWIYQLATIKPILFTTCGIALSSLESIM